MTWGRAFLAAPLRQPATSVEGGRPFQQFGQVRLIGVTRLAGMDDAHRAGFSGLDQLRERSGLDIRYERLLLVIVLKHALVEIDALVA